MKRTLAAFKDEFGAPEEEGEREEEDANEATKKNTISRAGKCASWGYHLILNALNPSTYPSFHLHPEAHPPLIGPLKNLKGKHARAGQGGLHSKTREPPRPGIPLAFQEDEDEEEEGEESGSQWPSSNPTSSNPTHHPMPSSQIGGIHRSMGGSGKKRQMDVFMEELKQDQQEREHRIRRKRDQWSTTGDGDLSITAAAGRLSFPTCPSSHILTHTPILSIYSSIRRVGRETRVQGG